MPAINFTGLASGLDTGAIVDQLIAAASRPIVRLEERIDTYDARKDAIGDVRSTVANLLTQIQALTNVAGLNARTALASKTATGDKTVVSVAVDSTAAVGSFQISVEQLATVTTAGSATPIGDPIVTNVALNSAGFATTITTGTFTINGTTITIDANTVLSDGVDDGTSNSILGRINNAGVSVTAAIVNDAQSNPNLLQLTSASAITLGAGDDTSNFLTAAHLLASPGTTTRTSTQAMGQVNAAVNLTVARLATSLSATTGTFSINGVQIAYDADNESLNDIISKINGAGTGVTATYDGTGDTLKLSADATGSIAISLVDVSGNFLAATGLLSATQTLGQNAAYKIDGGPTQYASSNTITTAITGVSLLLLDAAAGDNATVTVSDNVEAVVDAVDDFVIQFNSTMTILEDVTRLNLEGENAPLASDSSVRLLRTQLRSLAVGLGDNLTTKYTSMSDVGVTLGAVGAVVGTTGTMLLDQTVLREKIAEDRDAVVELFAALTVSATLQPNDGSLASVSGSPDKKQAGTYTVTDDGTGNLTVSFVPGDGSATTSTTGTITASGTNTILILGMTLTAKAILQAGSDSIVVTRDKAGVAVKLEELLTSYTRADGFLDSKGDAIDEIIEDYNDRIARLEDRLTRQRLTLEAKFTAMERIFSRFQAQQSVLTNLNSTFDSINRLRS